MPACPDCDDVFDTEMGLKVHHSKIHDGSLARPVVECANCGAEKRTTSYRARTNDHHFCDAECKGEWQSENRAGEDHPRWNPATNICEVCETEYTVPQHEADTTRYCSQDCHLQALAEENTRRTGPDHPSWRGGVSTYLAVRRSLGERSWARIADEYREKLGNECEWCGSPPPSSRALDVHHIVPIRTGGTHHDDNLLALCRSCHSTVERFTASLFGEVLVDEQYTQPLLPPDGSDLG